MPTIDVNDLTFGIEIETVIPVGSVRVGSYHGGRQVEGLPEGWKAERDCSIQCPAGHEACEFVSPVLKGADGLHQIRKVCDFLQVIGAKVNRSTGFHVHVGWTGDPEALKRLVSYVANFEKALFASTGTHAREEGNYCRPVRASATYTERYAPGASRTDLPYDRYHVLNLTNLRPGGKNTVEFRLFAGTTNATKMLGYVRLCLGLVEKAIGSTRPPRWTPKTPVPTSPIHRKGGEGQTDLTRLFYGIGWTKGRQPRPFGDIQPEGLPTIEDAKRELMRLARKYDGNGQGNPEDTQPTAATESTTPVRPRWETWTAQQWGLWESYLLRRTRIRVRLADGTDCDGTFVRRYPRNLLIRVSHLSEPILVPRANNPARSATNGAFPRESFN